MKRTFAGLVGLAALTSLLALGTPAAEATQVRLALPEPTGPYSLGKHDLLLVDHSRPDPWVPASGDRELLVSVWYPAALPVGPRAEYMTAADSELLLKRQGVTGVDPAVLSTTRTTARIDAPPLPGRGGRPLVVLSPGFSIPRTTLTGLAEDLASRGYVVAGIEHSYEADAATFPDGEVKTCVACDLAESGTQVVGGRVADVSFVLDELERRPVGKLVDWRRVGMAGHSIGGATAAAVMRADDRIRAGVNLDGTFHPRLSESGGLTRPFLLIGTEAFHRPGGIDPSWNEDWHLVTGWKRWLTVAGTGHFAFNDLPALANQLGISDPEAPLPGARAMEITRAYVAAFFDHHLRGRAQPLLDGPSERYSEVKFW
ncbi:alpha/beta hydrolase family protein [Flindersiella endophytica]